MDPLASPLLSVRELAKEDIKYITEYWLGSDRNFMESLGVDIAKIPNAKEWEQMLMGQLSQPIEQKQSYCLIWVKDNKAVGHSNVNKIIFGKEASMHLHLWRSANRQIGLGYQFVKMSLPWFFKNLKLEKLYSEPYALNPAPHRTLEKLGFQFESEYITTPGWSNFEQPVKRWVLEYKDFIKNNNDPSSATG
jgi:RimJ/RimL family protein N-acetyltransferase